MQAMEAEAMEAVVVMEAVKAMDKPRMHLSSRCFRTACSSCLVGDTDPRGNTRSSRNRSPSRSPHYPGESRGSCSRNSSRLAAASQRHDLLRGPYVKAARRRQHGRRAAPRRMPGARAAVPGRALALGLSTGGEGARAGRNPCEGGRSHRGGGASSRRIQSRDAIQKHPSRCRIKRRSNPYYNIQIYTPNL